MSRKDNFIDITFEYEVASKRFLNSCRQFRASVIEFDTYRREGKASELFANSYQT
jgi:hypothetical protein